MRFRFNIVFVIIFLLLFLNIVFAFEADISMPKNINIYDEKVDVSIYIFNNTNYSQLYKLKTHLSPFNTSLSSRSIRLESRKGEYVTLTIEPMLNSLYQKYNTSIEFTANNTKQIIPLDIIQNNNKKCNLDINYDITYNEDLKKFILDFTFINNTNYRSSIEVIDLENVDINITSKNIYIPARSNKEQKYVFENIDDSSVYLKYYCNYNNEKLELELPYFESNFKEDDNKYFSNLSGLVNLKNIDFFKFYNSIVFQLILIIILVILILSFSTRYIKYVYDR